MFGQYGLNLFRIDIQPGSDDHAVFPSCQKQEASLIEKTVIADGEPIFPPERVRRCAAYIVRKQQSAPHPDRPGLARGSGGRRVTDHDIDPLRGTPDRACRDIVLR